MIESDDEISRFASDWIAETIRGEHGGQAGDRVFDDRFIAFQFARPDLALSIALKVAELSDHEWVMGVLGAGALETLLHAKGQEVLPVFEDAGKRLASFREALDNVWPQGSVEQDYWLAFEALRERLGVGPRGLA